MAKKTEAERLQELRDNVFTQSEDTRETIELIQKLFGRVGANDMHNVSIMFNNKICELVNLYHRNDLEFFDFENHFLNAIIYDYLTDAYAECIAILDNIIKTLRQKKIFMPTLNFQIIRLIRKYVEISDSLYSFDIKEDVDRAFFAYCVTRAQRGYMIDKTKAMENMEPDLKKLDIDPEPIAAAYFNPKEITQSIIKKLKLQINKDIND